MFLAYVMILYQLHWLLSVVESHILIKNAVVGDGVERRVVVLLRMPALYPKTVNNICYAGPVLLS
jgi:hypothetical protein